MNYFRCRPLFIEAFDTTGRNILQCQTLDQVNMEPVAVLYSSRPSIQRKCLKGKWNIFDMRQLLPSSIHRGLRYNIKIFPSEEKLKQFLLPSSIHRGLRYNIKTFPSTKRPLQIELLPSSIHRGLRYNKNIMRSYFQTKD